MLTNSMTQRVNITRILTLLLTLFCGCTKATSHSNYAFIITEAPFFIYPSMAPLLPLAFSALQLNANLSVFTSFSGSVGLSAFTDSACSQAAPGTLTVPTNPTPFSAGVAQFSTFTYAPTIATQEALLYFKGTVTADGTSYCSPKVPLIQHFNSPAGSYFSQGKAATNPGTASQSTISDIAKAIKIDSNGHYIIAGTSKNAAGGTLLALWRFLPTGALDLTFNTVGSITLGNVSLTAATENEMVNDLQIDANGKYVLVGSSANGSGGNQLVLWRFNTDGTPDTTFSTAGRMEIGIPGTAGAATLASVNDTGKALRIASDGTLLVAGSSSNAAGGLEAFLRKFNADGSVSSSFGTSGAFISGTTGLAGATGAAELDQVNALQIDSSGECLLAGSSKNTSGGTEIALWKVSKQGTLDTSWGTNGFFHSGTTGATGATGIATQDSITSILLDSNNRWVATGSSQNPVSIGGTQMALWRFKLNGTLDTDFNKNGILLFGITGAAGGTGSQENDRGLTVAQDISEATQEGLASSTSDANILYVVSGTSRNINNGTEQVLWRYTAQGLLDKTFAKVGYYHFGKTVGTAGATGANIMDIPSAIVSDGLTTYITVGSSANLAGGTDLAVWRFLNIGILDL